MPASLRLQGTNVKYNNATRFSLSIACSVAWDEQYVGFIRARNAQSLHGIPRNRHSRRSPSDGASHHIPQAL